MSKVVTQEGITIEAKGDTLYFSSIPQEKAYSFGLFSLKFSEMVSFTVKYADFEEESPFLRGVWKKVEDGKTSFCLRDRGEGNHKLFVSFAPEVEGYPDYTAKYVYTIDISADNEVTISE